MPERHSISLRDGRKLSYLEIGDPLGVPVLFTVGSPSSGLGGLAFNAAAERNGIKLLSVDKPGYGHSSRDPKRLLARYGGDLVQLADALGLSQVAVAGMSGGGPHALSAAHALGERVSILSLWASAGPLAEPWAREALNPVMSVTTWFARNAPALMALPIGGLRLLMGNPERMERLVKRREHTLSEAQREMMRAPELRFLGEGIADAFATGLAGAQDEFLAVGRAWGFQLEDVTAQTDMWHGTADTSCPIEMARQMAQRLPNATLHELEDAGHNFFGQELDQAFASLRLKAQAAATS